MKPPSNPSAVRKGGQIGDDPRFRPSSASPEAQATFLRRLGRIREQQPAISQPGRMATYSKAATFILIPISLFYAVFIQDWGPKDHVFAEPQRWFRRQTKAFWSVPGEQKPQETSNKS
ncbi:hypothetical protein M422DRAFT_276033 [Sphaerobolus stellatus SS14]|uniref:Uncharacterized protein n=1 Tax=Sphaerobolus stellatus (strain SS14) TaxID=990650 RepID=A0A0C9UE50_SPHS4|nr:hypothetical protein M422DRAFT_276033 [Sphaerobolus stellatus SS14]